VAKLNFEGKVKAVEEEVGQTSATLDFGEWSAIINFSSGGGRGGRRGGAPAAAAPAAGARGARGAAPAPDAAEAAPAPAPTGRALVAQISKNQFYLTGSSCTIEFKAASGGQRDWLRVEEAEQLERTVNTKSSASKAYSPASAFKVMRILNGDETDHALPFSTAPEAVRVTLGTY
jgi:hypothetical protein